MVGDESIKLKWRKSGSGWSATVGASILGFNVNINYDIGRNGMFLSSLRAESTRAHSGGLLGLGPLKKTDINRRRKEQFGWDPCLNRLGLRTLLWKNQGPIIIDIRIFIMKRHQSAGNPDEKSTCAASLCLSLLRLCTQKTLGLWSYFRMEVG